MRYNLLRVLIFVAGHLFGATLLTACPEKNKGVEVETTPLPSPTITVTPVPVATVSPSGS